MNPRWTRRLSISLNITRYASISLTRSWISLGYILTKGSNLISSQRYIDEEQNCDSYRARGELLFYRQIEKAQRRLAACASVLLYPAVYNKGSDEMPLTEIIFAYYGLDTRGKSSDADVPTAAVKTRRTRESRVNFGNNRVT